MDGTLGMFVDWNSTISCDEFVAEGPHTGDTCHRGGWPWQEFR
jgi:hypothetical protein